MYKLYYMKANYGGRINIVNIDINEDTFNSITIN